jgi:hypothetical protein
MATRSMHNRLARQMRSELGVSLIHVAIVIFVVTAFTAFVLDHGVMLLGRAQAQNVADAAALAGVTTRLKEEPGDTVAGVLPAPNGDTVKVIQQSVDYHSIFGGAPADTGRTWSWDCPTGVVGWCVKVDVFRDGTNGGTTLPVFFANLLGTNSQKVRATATAVAKDANGTGCLKPWMIPDRWLELSMPPNDNFDIGVDEYRPWDEANPTGYTDLDVLAGTVVVLKPGTPAGAISPSDFFEIETAADYYENIINCQISAEVGDLINVLNGNRVGPTNMGVSDLIAAAGGPVDVVIGLFSPVEFAELDRQSGNNLPLHITNFIGVQISAMQGNQVQGTIVSGIGTSSGTAPTPTGSSSLIKTIQLVR